MTKFFIIGTGTLILIGVVGGAVIYFADPKDDIQPLLPLEERTSKDGCIVTGCSSQVCADKQVITTCELRPEHSCYRTAVCERQQNGECGWTQTPELIQCLAEPGEASQDLLPL
jgi:hypothetical protein